MAYRQDIERITQVISALREVDPVLPAQAIHVLLLVAARPGASAGELEQGAGLAASSVSRNLAALGEVHRNGKAGYGLIEQVKDPENAKRNMIYLTIKGRSLMRRLLSIETGKSAEDFAPPTAKEHARTGYARL